MSYLGETTNEYGTPVSEFMCYECKQFFTVCPAVDVEKRQEWDGDGCLAVDCPTYDPARDADFLFEMGLCVREKDV